MVTAAQLREAVTLLIEAAEGGIKDVEGCGSYRLRELKIDGEMVIENGVVVQSTVTNEPLAPSTTLATEAQTTQTQESTDSMEQQTQNSGAKIFGERVEVTDNT